jgi:protein-tyrosine phosphatase
LKPLLTISSVLVVCDGNHCRSPIAEALLRERSGGSLVVRSAGLSALEGLPPAIEAQNLMAELGIDISHFRGRQLTAGLALAADLILVMEERQKDACGQLVPSCLGRVFLLGHWRPAPEREIPDPFRRSEAFFRSALAQISSSIGDWLPHLIPERRNT